MDYGMRIKNNSSARIRNAINNGCIVITDEIIAKVPYVHVFIENYANREMQHYMKEVLTLSKNRTDKYLFGEVGILIDKGIMKAGVNAIKSISYGDYECIKVSKDVNYQKAINEHEGRNLAFIHSHTNGSSFSYKDISTFVNTTRISTIVAVGNNGKVYIINKGLTYNPTDVMDFLNKKALELATKDNNKLKLESYQNRATLELLKIPDKYGFEYYTGGIRP